MDYSERYQVLAKTYRKDEDFSLPGSNLKCSWLPFQSGYPGLLNGSAQIPEPEAWDQDLENDERVEENLHFIYPVFHDDHSLNKPAILLLHGLNERSWTKYLVWAEFLAENTGRPVILFPIAFHMNRSPGEWSDPRNMSRLLETRTRISGPIPMSSFVNTALSIRLTREPLRFLSSGYQSALDLMQLLSQIRSNQHPLLRNTGTPDVFAYSIGAFLAQILFLADPGSVFSNSRLFLFCGGAFFKDMHGDSRLIMDRPAFEALHRYYLHQLPQESKSNPALEETLYHSELGMAFRAMLDEDCCRSFRKDRLRNMDERLHVIGLENDRVIPAAAVSRVIEGKQNFEIREFPFEYTHENPFPVLRTPASLEVDDCFRQVFSRASEFLC